VVDKLKVVDKVVDKAKISEKMADKRAGIAGEFIKELTPYFNENEWLDTATICKIANKPPTTVKRYLKKLVETGMLEAQGANKNRQYRLLTITSVDLSTTQDDDKWSIK
jgi:predicted transcriptional regulator